MNESMNEWTNEWINKWINEWMNEWLNESLGIRIWWNFSNILLNFFMLDLIIVISHRQEVDMNVNSH